MAASTRSAAFQDLLLCATVAPQESKGYGHYVSAACLSVLGRRPSGFVLQSRPCGSVVRGSWKGRGGRNVTYHVEIWKGFGERRRMFGGPRRKGLVLEHFLHCMLGRWGMVNLGIFGLFMLVTGTMRC